MGTENQGLLSNRDGFTVFRFGEHTTRFRAPYSLERYTEVKKWDNGYIVVRAKYSHKVDVKEEYMDLVPILKDLYSDTAAFLEPIEGVRSGYDDFAETSDRGH